MKKRAYKPLILSIFLILIIPGVLAATIDVQGLKTDSYALGEEINYKVLLLNDDNSPINEEVGITIADALKRREVVKRVTANTDESILIEDNFPSGLWTMTVVYDENTKVERNFNIKENTLVEFIIEEDNLIIRNKGNTRYTKTVQIKIGTTSNSYAQNIGVGDEKTLKLISPEGTYDIEITDGETTISRKNIQLYGTGNVIGAVDEDLVGYTGFANVGDPENVENSQAAAKKYPITFMFIGAIFGLAILVTIERRLYKRKNEVLDEISEIPSV